MKAVFLMADTFRRDHVSCYGNHWIHTPNLQKLASCAAVFENAYLGSFPTIPNRRDLILGAGTVACRSTGGSRLSTTRSRWRSDWARRRFPRCW